MTTVVRVRALKIPVDGPPTVEPIACCLASYQLAVGGIVEALHPCPAWHAYYSDSSRAAGIEANPLANSLLRNADPASSELLCGPVLIVGTAEDGGEADVPAELIATAQALVRT